MKALDTPILAGDGDDNWMAIGTRAGLGLIFDYCMHSSISVHEEMGSQDPHWREQKSTTVFTQKIH